MNKLPLVNVVVRTFNEEDWIKFSLIKILEQNYNNFVITVVDSGSSDATLDVIKIFVKKYPKKITLKTIKNFKPGDAINIGARAQKSDYFICISAHCIPTNSGYIKEYVNFMQDNNDENTVALKEWSKKGICKIHFRIHRKKKCLLNKLKSRIYIGDTGSP